MPTISHQLISIGQQEYSSRQAGITFGIVLAVIIPIILILAYAGYLILKKRNKDDDSWQYDSPSTPRRLKEDIDSRAISPTTPTSDDEYTYKSPILSDRGSSETDSSTSKKRRSYDKSYRTNEPLKGLPEVEFEEKPWDVDSPTTTEYEPETKPIYPQQNEYAEPFDDLSRRATLEADQKQGRSASNPNLLGDSGNVFSYSPDDYAVVNKDKKRGQSQSSIITEV